MWLVVFILSLMQSEAVTALTDELEKKIHFFVYAYLTKILHFFLDEL